MAAVRSLGLHTPTGLSYLIEEGFLQADPPESAYHWETYDDVHGLEEVLYTEQCVVWSRGGVVKKAYSFVAEGENVKHAVLTSFPVDDIVTDYQELGYAQSSDQPGISSNLERQISGQTNADRASKPKEGLSRALVVFLNRQAHIYFLSGATHLVHLHFDVARVFPAPRGLIIERKLGTETEIPPATPEQPKAPPNSFLSPFAPRIGQAHWAQTKTKVTEAGGLDFDLLRKAKTSIVDNLPKHFCLTSPLSEVGLIVHSPHKLSGSTLSRSQRQGDLTALEASEEILYVSRFSELLGEITDSDCPLILVVTANKDRQVYKIWQALYADSKSATALFRERQSPSGVKARRRSSFITRTGATTPALRQDEGFPDTITVKKRGKKLSTLNASQSTAISDAGGEDLLVSQLDPDFDTHQPAKASRRVSSMLSRAELSTNQDRSAFQELAMQTNHRQSFGPHGRRGQSFGGQVDRTSFGITSQRRLRSSTPGAFSRLSLDDMSENGTIMNFEVDDTLMTDDLNDYDDIFDKHSELDSFDFRLPFDGLRREVLFHRIAEIPMSESIPLRYSFGSVAQSSLPECVNIFTIASHEMSSETSHTSRRYFMHIMNRETKEHIQLEFFVQTRRKEWPDVRSQSALGNPLQSSTIPIAVAKKVTRLKGQSDACKIEDNGIARVLCLRNKGGESALQLYAPWSPENAYTIALDRLRIFSPFDVATPPPSSPRTIGKQRTMLDIRPFVQISHPGPGGTCSLRDVDDRIHRVQIQLAPRNDQIAKLLRTLQFVLPSWLSDLFLCIWWNRHQSIHDDVRKDWHALALTVFAIALALEDGGGGGRKSESSGPRPSPSKSRRISANTLDAFDRMVQTEADWDVSRVFGQAGWTWTDRSRNLVSKSADPLAALIAEARNFIRSKTGLEISGSLRAHSQLVGLALSRIIATFHLFREEEKLHANFETQEDNTTSSLNSAVLIAQLARWMDWTLWDWKDRKYYSLECAGHSGFEDFVIKACTSLSHPLAAQEPPSIYAWLEKALTPVFDAPFPSLDAILNVPMSPHLQTASAQLFPRITAISKYLVLLRAPALSPEKQIEAITEAGISPRMLETLPSSIIAILKDILTQCQAYPPTTWSSDLLDLINREDLALLASGRQPQPREPGSKQPTSIRDAHTVCQAAETPLSPFNLPEYSDRIWISRLIFNEDRRLVEAMHLVEPLRTAVAVCPHDPSWSEQQMLDAQKDVIQWVMTRTFALAPGNGMAHFDSRHPLLTEKYAIHGYSMLCKMQPMGNTVSADRTTLSEEKYGWSWFHAGVAAGLSISRDAQGIDTSWIIFNRPPELTNRHAGLLLALGLNGHLKSVARWLCFKYLTPKHTMTSIGLLLGLSASHLGTMDTLVTRLLSVHITRMLPPGAAELNLSPLTQTAGLMGIGLLYCGTQHRRMSEVMLSEIENVEIVDPADSSMNVRDEGYRLAAGFALGYINLGKGSDIRGLNDMKVVERLLAVAVGPRPVDLVHILDQATASATIAVALIFMKTGNKTVARKIDVPDTLPQFDYVRPDILLLRTLAKHLILWDEIVADDKWIIKNLPRAFASFYHMRDIQTLKSEHMPFYYILAGMLWSIGLRYAGSGNKAVSTFLVSYLDRFIRICKLPAHRYDAKLTRNTVRNCQDLVALSCATVMAGTGDLDVMRRLRMLHGRTNADTPYGSHLAVHMALGALFLGAGTFTFGTSNLAIASLICAFYPLFPIDVTDNKAHLQPFRHLWVLAAEARCIITREVDTNRPVRVPLTLKLRDGSSKVLTAPCLLPELETIADVKTSGMEYWPMTLDFQNNPSHLLSFKKHQTLYVRKRPPGNANTNTFSATFHSLNDAQTTTLVGARKLFRSVFELPFFKEYGLGTGLEDVSLILPSDDRSSIWQDAGGSVVDMKLMLKKIARGGLDRNALWNLRVLFKWSEMMEEWGHGGMSWLGREVMKDLKGIVEERARRLLKGNAS
ncbi:uncharacterized protein PV09_05913 [Verruconis gallopava]|uniref:Uncharacterized protein n=1 Tax=Verruconis gallopava TaxID=253628 RepID=A0A0D2A8D8_9PEZI|nr:uncharacterized protein PV09_05913 [Verruconis gallopava]KIW02860.1 hypothetical protein PV09_05913 [Verruconis gallopava]